MRIGRGRQMSKPSKQYSGLAGKNEYSKVFDDVPDICRKTLESKLNYSI